jgi:multiple sugar transport system ATP-binding protein
VAQFIGSPQMNLVPVAQLPQAGQGAAGAPAGGFVGLRPEAVSLQPAAQAGDGGLPGTVDLVEALGAETLVYVSTDSGAQIVARQASRTALHNGDRVGVFLDLAQAHRFDADGRAVRPAA